MVAIPLAAALFYAPQRTGAAAVVTMAVAVLAGLPHDAFNAPHVAALIAIMLAGGLAIAFAVERQARDRFADFASFLGDAGTLLSSSLDFDTTAKAVASVPVPELADWCLVELLAPDGSVERRAASHDDESIELLSTAIATAAERDRGPRSELWPELPDALLETWAGGEAERLAELRSAGARAAMRVPLRTPGRLAGTMTFVTTGPGTRFTELDLRRAEELAGRCSLAIDNALLYRAARSSRERRFGRRVEPPASGRPEPRGIVD
jgi:GAF domain-containing protein